MDPHRNPALHNVELLTILRSQSNSRSETSCTEDMPAPPAYHLVVDPNMPIPNVRSPYNPEDEDEKEQDDMPEFTINAATQVRGNGNIISIAQMDSMRIASLLATILNGKIPEPAGPLQPQPQPTQMLPSMATLRTEEQLKKPFPKINITVNCGATVIGDRNIIGPGLGDIARQMQMAQRNQASQAQQQQAQGKSVMLPAQQQETLYQAQASIAQNHGLYAAQAPTPPMSRSPSLQSDASGGAKRKVREGAAESVAKRHC